jgi:hypothetical protein
MNKSSTVSVAIMLLGMLLLLSFISSCSSISEKSPLPDKTDVDLAYQNAVEAYGWFDMTTMPLDYSVSKDYNNMTYYKVDHEFIKNYDDLARYLRSLFSETIVNQLLDQSELNNRYIDIDGQLYAIPADRGADITKGDETHQVIFESDNKIIYRVEVDVIDPGTGNVVNKEVHDFYYELMNVDWVFTNFYLIR